MKKTACPLESELRQFVTEGHVSDEQRLAEHLDECLRCRNAIDDMQRELGPPRLRKLPSPAAAAVSDPSTPSEVGPYLIDLEVGGGSYGIVYKARHRVTNQCVALKVFHGRDTDPLVLRRLKREAELAGAIDHPNVVKIFEAGSVDGRTYCSFE